MALVLTMPDSQHPPQGLDEPVKLTVNGQSGTVVLASGDPYFYSWRTTDQTTCEITSPFPSGSTLRGVSSLVAPGSMYYYPTADRPVTLRMLCVDSQGNASLDEVTVKAAD
ncbi:MAG: hypothetical protein Q7R30_16920 [Acidobacteriota bacterium]|nr:hypothetical protein [Acidobacteriota bacterium]